MARDIEMQDPTAIMADNEETIEQAESHRWNREEVHCCNNFAMVLQKREPSFRGFGISWSASHPTGNRSFGNIESYHQKSPVDSGCAPGRIISDHSKYQITNFLRDSFPTEQAARS